MNYRILLITIFLFAIIGMPIFAQNSSTSTAALIEQLKQQIANLQAQIAQLQEQLKLVKEAEQQVKQTTLQLRTQLRQGMSSEDVKLLQEFLASDPDIYPEGFITGYFGVLTRKAVERFQKKACISPVGIVGPQTFWRINELLTEGAGKFGHVPPGLLRAPGILKKLCGTSTPDTIAPVISEVEATNISTSSCQITWKTDESADSKVWYSTSASVDTESTSTPFVSDSSKTTNHVLTLSGLTANTVYYYIAASKDAAGNASTSSIHSFSTLSLPDTTAPVISALSATNTTTSTARIIWTTDELSNSKVYYSTITPVDTVANSTLSVADVNMVTGHSLDLTGLTNDTTYYYFVTSADVAGNVATSSEPSFATLP